MTISEACAIQLLATIDCRSAKSLGRFIRFVFLLILLSGFPATPSSAQSAVVVSRVLLVSCDGLRPDAIVTAKTPVMDRLIAFGSYQSTALAELPPVTLPNHASMVTGLTIPHHGILFNTSIPGRIPAKTIFDVAESAGLSVGFFANKTKLSFLCEENSVEAWQITGDVDALADTVVSHITEKDLRLIFVHFGEPDGTGHRDGWMSEPYLGQVTRVDAALGRILGALEAKGVIGQTLVIVLSDHGGHANTHFLNIPEDRFIPFILNGPGIAAGRLLCEQVRPMDAAATALNFLGLPTETASDGKVVTEALIEIVQPSCTKPVPQLGLPCGPLPWLLIVTTSLMFLCISLYRKARSIIHVIDDADQH